MADDKIEDKQLGISIRFIGEWSMEQDRMPAAVPSMTDLLVMLACADDRDVSFMTKLCDAREYLRLRIH